MLCRLARGDGMHGSGPPPSAVLPQMGASLKKDFPKLCLSVVVVGVTRSCLGRTTVLSQSISAPMNPPVADNHCKTSLKQTYIHTQRLTLLLTFLTYSLMWLELKFPWRLCWCSHTSLRLRHFHGYAAQRDLRDRSTGFAAHLFCRFVAWREPLVVGLLVATRAGCNSISINLHQFRPISINLHQACWF